VDHYVLGKEQFGRGYLGFQPAITEKISEKLFLRFENFIILGRDAASMNGRIPKFRDKRSVPHLQKWYYVVSKRR